MSTAPNVTKGELMYEGKAKRVYRTDDPTRVIIEYKDDATAFNAQKKGSIQEKGVVNNKITAALFTYLERHGIPTHFIERLSDRESLAKAVTIIPIEVVVRNVAAGSLAARLGLAEGTPLPQTVVEFYYKDDALGDPLINRFHARALGLATDREMDIMTELALRINRLLIDWLAPVSLRLIDFKLEFGRHGDDVILADEISPDTCRLWDAKTEEKLDKDRFRRDLGGVEEAYQEVLRRIEARVQQAKGEERDR